MNFRYETIPTADTALNLHKSGETMLCSSLSLPLSLSLSLSPVIYLFFSSCTEFDFDRVCYQVTHGITPARCHMPFAIPFRASAWQNSWVCVTTRQNRRVLQALPSCHQPPSSSHPPCCELVLRGVERGPDDRMWSRCLAQQWRP